MNHAELARALSGDRAALARLVDGLMPVIHARVARALLRRRANAGARDLRQAVEDLTQEVFLALFAEDARVLRSWDPDRGLSLKNFAGLVAERQASSILRTGKRSPWTEEPTSAEDLEASLRLAARDPASPAGASVPKGPEDLVASKQELEQILERLFEELSPLGRRVFEALFIEELPVDQICARLDLSPDAVYAWRSRLTKQARLVWQRLMSETEPGSRTPVKAVVP